LFAALEWDKILMNSSQIPGIRDVFKNVMSTREGFIEGGLK